MPISFSSTALLLVVGVLWGLNWPAVKFMMGELPTFTIRAVAFPIAALILLFIAIIKKERLRPARGEWVPLMVTGVLLVFAFNMLTSLGQTLTDASQAAIVAYTMPAMTAALSVIFLKESLDQRILVALVLGMLGIAILLSRDFSALMASPRGTIVMLAAAFFWSAGNITLKAHQWQMPATARAAWFFAISTVLAWPVVFLLDEPAQWQMPSPPVIATWVFHILGPMVTCYLLWGLLLTRLSASVAAISILTAPVVGVLAAVVLLGDELGWQKILALALIMSSIVATNFLPGRSE